MKLVKHIFIFYVFFSLYPDTFTKQYKKTLTNFGNF